VEGNLKGLDPHIVWDKLTPVAVNIREKTVSGDGDGRRGGGTGSGHSEGHSRQLHHSTDGVDTVVAEQSVLVATGVLEVEERGSLD